MAFDTAHLDGSTTAVSSDHPYGYTKNDPAGTRVNNKMLADIFQFFQYLMAASSTVPNNLPDSVSAGLQLWGSYENNPLNGVAVMAGIASGITTLNTEVATLLSEVAFGVWTNITLGTGYTAAGSTPSVQVRKDGVGRVYIRGAIVGSGSSGITNIATIPAGFLPATQGLLRPCSCLNAGVEYTKSIGLNFVTGELFFNDGTIAPTTGWVVSLDGLGTWLTT